MSVAVAVFYLAILVGVYRLLLQRHLGISLRGMVSELGPAIAGCLALVAVGEPLRMLVAPQLGPALTIAVVGAAGGLVYGATLRAVSPAAWKDLGLLLARVLPLPV